MSKRSKKENELLEFLTVVYNFKQPLHQTELRPARL